MNKVNIATLVIGLTLLVFLYYAVNNRDTTGDTVAETNQKTEVVNEAEIQPSEVAIKINNNEDIVLLDVRTPAEFEQIHIKDSLLLPLQVLSPEELVAAGLGEEDKDKEIVIYCRSGNRSLTAYNMMRSLGYTNVKSMAGGVISWEEDQMHHLEAGPYIAPSTI